MNTNKTEKQKAKEYLAKSKERFFNRIKEDDNGCWLFQGSLNPQGYGNFHYKSLSHLSHRWAAEHLAGLKIKGMCVCHHCDNPSCVNPAHLFVGTQADNMRDMDRKGRRVLPPKSAAGGVPVHTPYGDFFSIWYAADMLNVSPATIHYRFKRLPHLYWRI
jgi:hypothetical protein